MSEMIFANGKLVARVARGIGHMMLANPLRKNAVSQAMWRAIPEAIDWFVEDRNVRVIILSGDGGTDFSAGADISEFRELRKDTASAMTYEDRNSAAFRALREAEVPVIAAISGICFGGGMGLAAACDLRLADETARFCVPAARLGLAYPADAVVDFVSTMGGQRTRHALFTGMELGPQTLLDCGFLLAVTPAGRLMEEVNAIADAIAANAPLSVKASKLSIRATIEGGADLVQAARSAGAHTFESRDYAEGRQAFADRRKPDFTGQ